MASIVLISGSASPSSRSAALLEHARRQFIASGLQADLFGLRDFPSDDLLYAKYDSPAFERLKKSLDAATAVVIATPVYKASYTGGLKTILDVFPQSALREKTVLPLATGGSTAHQLAIDYALKPVLSALGATDLLQGVYVVDKQLTVKADGTLDFADEELAARFKNALEHLIGLVAVAPSIP